MTSGSRACSAIVASDFDGRFLMLLFYPNHCVFTIFAGLRFPFHLCALPMVKCAVIMPPLRETYVRVFTGILLGLVLGVVLNQSASRGTDVKLQGSIAPSGCVITSTNLTGGCALVNLGEVGTTGMCTWQMPFCVMPPGVCMTTPMPCNMSAASVPLSVPSAPSSAPGCHAVGDNCDAPGCCAPLTCSADGLQCVDCTATPELCGSSASSGGPGCALCPSMGQCCNTTTNTCYPCAPPSSSSVNYCCSPTGCQVLP